MTESRALLVNQAIREFARAQVINVASKKHKRIFRIDPHFRLYDELKDLVMESEWYRGDDEITRLVKRISNMNLAILTGIFTFQPQLTVDLLFVGENINRSQLIRILNEIEKLVGQEVNYAALDPKEYEYRRLMNDRFIRDVLDHPHLTVFD